ncbi:MAG: tetratricopeptide repeat protein [Okeania sp. SIO2D1]|nr:tetratricopeptide repeat protein [Okeania sp. SIO2D1]
MILRGIWLTNVDSKVLHSRDNIAEAMDFLAETGFNVVFPVVWNKAFTLALEMKKQLLGSVHPSIATSLNNLGSLYDLQERYAEAESLYLEALEMKKQLLGATNPDHATSLNNLAELYRSQNWYKVEALEMRKQSNNSMTTVTLEDIEIFRSQLADYPEALAALDEIEENEGDLEYATQMIALEAGIEISREDGWWLKHLSKRCRNLICKDEFKDDIVAGVTTSLVASLAASGNLPVMLATPLVIYIVKIGIKNFCNATDDES